MKSQQTSLYLHSSRGSNLLDLFRLRQLDLAVVLCFALSTTVLFFARTVAPQFFEVPYTESLPVVVVGHHNRGRTYKVLVEEIEHPPAPHVIAEPARLQQLGVV